MSIRNCSGHVTLGKSEYFDLVPGAHKHAEVLTAFSVLKLVCAAIQPCIRVACVQANNINNYIEILLMIIACLGIVKPLQNV